MIKKSNHQKFNDLSKQVGDRENAERVKSLQTKFEDGNISRRSFIQSALALGVSLTSSTSFVDVVQAATPKKGGRLRIGITGGSTSDVLDPGQMVGSYMLNYQFGQLRNNLTEVAPNGELIPELAESWEASPNAKSWHFKLRKDVEFHNGKALDSQDVVDSLNHHIKEDSSSAAKAILAGITSIKADGPNAVTVELVSGDADFPFLMTDYHLNICASNGDGSIDWQSGNGTGGYMPVEHEPGVRSLTKRNPNYWKQDMAHFDEVELIQIADATARTNALRTDSVDCYSNVDLKTASRLEQVAGVNIRSTTGNRQVTLPMRTDTAPFDNNEVRLALKHLIQRDEWLEKVVFGYGELGNDTPIGPANIFRATTDEIPQRYYDVDKAKFHLKKAGMEKLTVPFHAAETGFGGALDAAQLMQESASKAGVKINIVREPDDGYWSDVWMKKPWIACYWNGRPTENWIFTQLYAADAAWNDTFWKHDNFNKLLLQARAELDETKRREMYVEMQRILHDEGGVIIPLFQSDVLAHSDKVHVPEVIGNNWDLDGEKNAERWWFV